MEKTLIIKEIRLVFKTVIVSLVIALGGIL